MSGSESPSTTASAAVSCDYTKLQQCLERNHGDRSKCQAEWEEFQRQCRERKYVVPAAMLS
ncbi:hypothetical protein H4R34_003873 [Dimargaris verticillata]|uniref:Uncharacterized protein n=1 Tax=Dimargaris verticillata TaxID=2761393 RepID=A0A9W8ECR2_9FUNG|nr:hypothetical protein H4R34_003873 [Dimargaris verticillata]